jgi:hypothetical protein
MRKNEDATVLYEMNRESALYLDLVVIQQNSPIYRKNGFFYLFTLIINQSHRVCHCIFARCV